MNSNRIICGDAKNELSRLETDSAQVVMADPPYRNVLLGQAWDTQWKHLGEYLEWTQVWVAECLRVLREDGLCFISGQLGKREHGFIHLMSDLCRRHPFHDLLIWDRWWVTTSGAIVLSPSTK